LIGSSHGAATKPFIPALYSEEQKLSPDPTGGSRTMI